jgi:hypothetical protein
MRVAGSHASTKRHAGDWQLVDLLVSHHRHFIRDGKLTRWRSSVGRSREERERRGEEGLGQLRSPQVCSRFAACNGRSKASDNTSMFLTSHVVLTCTMPVSLSLPTVCFCSSGHCAILRMKRVSIAAAFRSEVWRGRRIAPTREGPRNESSNRAHESTSGRSTHYASGHLIRVFRGIGHIFSSPYPFSLAVLFLSRFGRRAGLVHLRQTFVWRCHCRWRCGSPAAICGAGAVARDCRWKEISPGQGLGGEPGQGRVSRADQTSASALCLWERC